MHQVCFGMGINFFIQAILPKIRGETVHLEPESLDCSSSSSTRNQLQRTSAFYRCYTGVVEKPGSYVQQARLQKAATITQAMIHYHIE